MTTTAYAICNDCSLLAATGPDHVLTRHMPAMVAPTTRRTPQTTPDGACVGSGAAGWAVPQGLDVPEPLADVPRLHVIATPDESHVGVIPPRPTREEPNVNVTATQAVRAEITEYETDWTTALDDLAAAATREETMGAPAADDDFEPWSAASTATERAAEHVEECWNSYADTCHEYGVCQSLGCFNSGRPFCVRCDPPAELGPVVDPSRVADIGVAYDAWRVAKIRHRAAPTHDSLAVVERRWEAYADACDRINMCLSPDCLTLGCTDPAHTLPADAITSTCDDCGERIWWSQTDPRVRLHTDTTELACPVPSN